MSKEERARQAKLRREREKQEAVDAAVKQAKAEADRETAELLQTLGLTNRYRDNAPITTRDELRQWQQDARDEKLRQRLKSGQLTQEDLQQAAQAAPEVQQLKAQVQQLQQQEAARQRQAAEQQIRKELEEIRKLDPSIKSVKDILDMPTGQAFSQLVQEKNLNFVEAFKLANMDQLQQVQQRAAEEAQARNYHSKDHLVGVGSKAGTPVSIPKQTYSMYRMLRPEMTDEQIRQDYARRQKGRS